MVQVSVDIIRKSWERKQLQGGTKESYEENLGVRNHKEKPQGET